ncbi:hypothetical protein HFD88_008482 [Aspergillus terreus]|nr:hypothetical protein HFD88_008482 [Aspergillus terreus]
MPPFSTPFRLPSARPTSSSRAAGPQFASTPRFLLSQTPAQTAHSDDVIETEDSPQATPIGTARVPRPTQKEAIEDSDEELDQQAPDPQTRHVVSRRREELSSSPPENAPELDAEFEALFGAIPDRGTKRRRRSADIETPSTQRRRPGADLIESSPPDTDPASPNTAHNVLQPFQTPVQPRADAVRLDALPEGIPQKTVSVGATEPPHTSTPTSTRPSFRGHPRFVLSASQAPPSSQSHPTIRPFATPARSSSPSRRKPGFVLPRSPSPSEADNDPSTIPTPFSPSSRALRRRGRPRSTAPEYLPGGMAAEVRSWILEMATKREALQMNAGHAVSDSVDLKKYFLAFRVDEVRQSALGSSGPLAFARGRPVDSSGNAGEDVPQKNILLVGPPRSRSIESPFQSSTRTRVPDLQAGNLIGICRGLVWELDLDDPVVGKTGELENLITMDSSGDLPAGKWLVGMEWEVL